MNSILSSLSATLLCAAASAQCFETNFGTSLGTGDDQVFAMQPMNITFPYGGVAASYTHCDVGTNGILYLTNGVASGGSTTGYSTSAATVLANLRGTAGQPPRIAPCFSDLNNIAPGAVYLNNTIAGKCVITWVDTRTYSLSTLWTTQVQLFQNGDVVFYYSPTAAAEATGFTFGLTCGISPGNGIAAVPAMNLSAGGSSAGMLVFEQFPAGTFDLAGKSVTFTAAGGGYTVSTAACGASNVPYGMGCGGQFASFYEAHATAATAGPALTGNSLVLLPTGVGYVATWGGGVFVPPGAASTLAVGDDSEVAQGLSSPFPTPSGPVSSIMVHGNGVITMGATGQSFPGTNSYTPTVPGFLDASQTAFWSWHDYNSSEAGSGSVKYEEALNANNDLIAYITWDGVENYASPEVANPSTLQFQLTLTGGNAGVVVIVWVNIDANPSSTWGSGHIVGFSPGGTNVDPGSVVLATAAPIVVGPLDVPHLSLDVAPNPVIGNTLTFTTSNIPATAVISAQMVSLAAVMPGIDLGFMGAPGCFQHIDLTTAATVIVPGTPTATYMLTLPNSIGLVGLPLAAQSASLVFGLNPLGIATTRGVLSVIGSF